MPRVIYHVSSATCHLPRVISDLIPLPAPSGLLEDPKASATGGKRKVTFGGTSGQARLAIKGPSSEPESSSTQLVVASAGTVATVPATPEGDASKPGARLAAAESAKESSALIFMERLRAAEAEKRDALDVAMRQMGKVRADAPAAGTRARRTLPVLAWCLCVCGCVPCAFNRAF